MTGNEIRIAVVGLGQRALDTWLPMLEKIEGYRIVAICDRLQPMLDRAAACLPDGVRTYTRYEDVLADPQIEAIALTLRAPNQGALAAQGLEAGKHVHAEVPAAHTLEDCRRLVTAAQSSGKVYCLAEQTRYWGFVESWRDLVTSGRLGRVTYVEGHYFHYLPDDKFVDPATGEFYGPRNRPSHAVPSWQQRMPPIHYLPHELSPLLKILDDRVVEVVGMESGPRSLAHPEIEQADVQVALMRTKKGTILRMAASFSQPHPHSEWHWYQIIGTGGRVEWRRAPGDQPKMWTVDGTSADLSPAAWTLERDDADPDAAGSGHGDADYYVHVAFRNAVWGVAEPELSVVDAVATAAPAIVAAQSIEQGSVLLPVPDFGDPSVLGKPAPDVSGR